MSKLNFYDVDMKYIAYLKQSESKIPDISYKNHDKFVCGVVLYINNMQYYAPISSFNKQQKTNFVILNEDNKPISSIRFSFMLPVLPEFLKLKNFNEEEYKYKRLLLTELKYCNDNIEKIFQKALQVYKIGTNKNHPLAKNCCDFKLLEQKCAEYLKEKALEEVAAGAETPPYQQFKPSIKSKLKEINKKSGSISKGNIER